ncbi:PREDICTED: uncharacterized protein LOC101302173 [Fragaria vesca subsp. vesca]
MHRRNQKFSRKRFFQDLQKEETSASKTSDGEHGHTKEQLEAGKNALEENTDNKLQLKSRKSARKRFFQNMKIPIASETSMNKDNEADAERSTIFGSIPELQLTSRTSARKRFFENLEIPGASETSINIDNEIDADSESTRSLYKIERAPIYGSIPVQNANGNLCSFENPSPFGQAYYQRQKQDYASRARKKQGVITKYKDFGDNTFQCVHCGAYYWQNEKNMRGIYTGCCRGGRVKLPPPNTTPPFLENLLNLNNNFRDNIRLYNSMFTFTSMGANIEKHINDGSGPYVFKICGQVHHLMGSILPINGQPPKYAQLYVYDTRNEVSNRINALRPNKKQRIDPNIVKGLIEMFDEINELAKLFRNIRDKFEDNSLPSFNMTFLSRGPSDSRQYEEPTNEEIAGLVIGDIGEFHSDRDIIVQSNDGFLRRISKIHPKYMSLQYPLLFPYGEDGYKISLKLIPTSGNEDNEGKRMSMGNYIAYQIHDRNNKMNTLLKGGRLFQQYLVDAYATVEENRLDYIRKNQDKFRIEKKMDIFAAASSGITESRDVGQRIILPSSHTGSPRDMINNYQDAMAICRQYGNPDLFITFTCNPKWPEITRYFKNNHGYKQEDRPDITSRIFQMKLEDMITYIKSGEPFGEVEANAPENKKATPIRSIKAHQLNYKITVRVGRIWRPKKYDSEDYDGLHYILIDENGDTIEAIIEEEYCDYVTEKMKEGEIYNIYKFHNRRDPFNIRVTNHPIQLLFNRYTIFEPTGKTVPSPPRYGFHLLEFHEFTAQLDKQDVYAVFVPEKKKMVPVRNIVLANLRREELQVSLWGDIRNKIDVKAVDELPSATFAVITSLKATNLKGFQRQEIK